jgi:hypothetical protein
MQQLLSVWACSVIKVDNLDDMMDVITECVFFSAPMTIYWIFPGIRLKIIIRKVLYGGIAQGMKLLGRHTRRPFNNKHNNM